MEGSYRDSTKTKYTDRRKSVWIDGEEKWSVAERNVNRTPEILGYAALYASCVALRDVDRGKAMRDNVYGITKWP